MNEVRPYGTWVAYRIDLYGCRLESKKFEPSSVGVAVEVDEDVRLQTIYLARSCGNAHRKLRREVDKDFHFSLDLCSEGRSIVRRQGHAYDLVREHVVKMEEREHEVGDWVLRLDVRGGVGDPYAPFWLQGRVAEGEGRRDHCTSVSFREFRPDFGEFPLPKGIDGVGQRMEGPDRRRLAQRHLAIDYLEDLLEVLLVIRPVAQLVLGVVQIRVGCLVAG
mmetsp:Transcript_38164/g.93762  ORF Transcript_38164/g.93762 Transcript_38164/m.93762 type:complete len:220 (-) Transcript_38164:863-1522(-)